MLASARRAATSSLASVAASTTTLPSSSSSSDDADDPADADADVALAAAREEAATATSALHSWMKRGLHGKSSKIPSRRPDREDFDEEHPFYRPAEWMVRDGVVVDVNDPEEAASRRHGRRGGVPVVTMIELSFVG